MAKKKAGIGALGSGKARFFHPRQPIKDHFKSDYAKAELHNVLIVDKGQRRINNKQQKAYDVRINELDESQIFSVVCSHLKVTQEGPTPFDDEAAAPAARTAPTDAHADDRASNVNATPSVNIQDRNTISDDITQLRREGIEVDNEDVAPENIAPPTADTGRWELPNTCPRKADPNITNSEGRWKEKSWSTIKEMDLLSVFRMCMPEDYIIKTIIPATNKHLDEKLTLSELYKWLGLRFYMACYVGVSPINQWWSKSPPSMFKGAPFRLNEYMSLNRFQAIDKAIRYTDKPPPTDFEDKFHDVRQMLEAFNDHMEAKYTPSWLSCLDESMNSWLNKYCPGFMVVPRKPHPFGNEYHSIADGDKGYPIMWRVKIQEGKDRPKKADGSWAFPSEFESYSKTAKLMLEMTKPIHGSGKSVSMDSGFCVSAGILAMHDHGVYGQALVKKRGRYWPKGVPGDAIDAHFANKKVGEFDCYMQDMEGKSFKVHCHKEDGYVQKIMSTHGLMVETSREAWRMDKDRQWGKFQLTEPIANHNQSKHWVDDVNNRRHAPIGLEDIWATKWWPHRQFTFICSVAEVNANNSIARANNAPAMHQVAFRKALAEEMINNKITDSGGVRSSPIRARKRSRESIDEGHELQTKPHHAASYDRTKKQWRKSKQRYLKQKCGTCKREVRTYCTCDKSVPMCNTCYAKHLVDVNNTI
eukprot:scaffold48896_cov69-Cyclotella_meneghiniana.AAC.2